MNCCTKTTLVRMQDPWILMYVMLTSLPDDGSGQLSIAAVPHIDSPSLAPLNSINALSLSLSVANSHSVKNKQAELQAFLVTHNLNIIIGTESHLDDSISGTEIFPSH